MNYNKSFSSELSSSRSRLILNELLSQDIPGSARGLEQESIQGPGGAPAARKIKVSDYGLKK